MDEQNNCIVRAAINIAAEHSELVGQIMQREPLLPESIAAIRATRLLLQAEREAYLGGNYAIFGSV